MRFPDALGKPRTRRTLSEMLLDVARKARKLFDSVLFRDGNQDGLVETSAHQLHLAGRHQQAQPVEILRMILLNPEQQRARVVQGQTNLRVLFDEG